MAKITYIIGAGASYWSVPLVADVQKRLVWFIQYCTTLRARATLSTKNYELFIEDANWVLNCISERTTFDTFAQELYNAGEIKKLEKLKTIMSAFLFYEQLQKADKYVAGIKSSQQIDDETVHRVNTTVDPRYRSFLQFVAPGGRLKEGINIISWNYDLQFELASDIQGDISTASANLNVFPELENSYNQTRPSLIKLNGTAGAYTNRQGAHQLDLIANDMNEREFMSYVINRYGEVDGYSNYQSTLSFACEMQAKLPTPQDCPHIVRAREIMVETEILVVIGYSFHQFNWTIDQFLCSDANKVQRIYYQVKSDVYERFIRDRLRAIKPEWVQRCQQVEDLSEFFFPPEAGGVAKLRAIH